MQITTYKQCSKTSLTRETHPYRFSGGTYTVIDGGVYTPIGTIVVYLCADVKQKYICLDYETDSWSFSHNLDITKGDKIPMSFGGIRKLALEFAVEVAKEIRRRKRCG